MRSKVKLLILLFMALAMGMVFGCGISDGPSTESAADPAGANVVAGNSTQNSEGMALYASKCVGCHGNIDETNIVTPTSFSDIRDAISSNMGGMRIYSAMSDADVQAIADAINNPTSALLTSAGATSPATLDGAAIYASRCAACHRDLASSNKIGTSVARVQNAIAGNVGGMGFLSVLTTPEVQAVVSALNPGGSPPALSASQSTDGAALYTANCAGCHGALESSTKKGITLSRLQSATNGNVGGMGFLSQLTAIQQQAIVAVLSSTTPSPTTETDGAILYSANCAGCHGVLASSGKAGATTSRIQSAISGNVGNMGYLSSLSAAQIAAIASVLAQASPPSPTPVTDGTTLYSANCAGCHGVLASSGKAGATTSRIQSAISGNVGNMGYLSTLSTDQVAAIAAVLTTAAPPAPTDGAGLYAANCASCHGSLARSEVRGESASEISKAISKNKGGMKSLSALTSGMIKAIANALKK